MTRSVDEWRSALEAGVEREFGSDRVAGARGMIDLAAECLALVDALDPDEWTRLLPDDDE